MTRSFSDDCKTTYVVIIGTKSDYLNLMQYQKHALKIRSEKTRKNDEFTLLNMSLEPYKLA